MTTYSPKAITFYPAVLLFLLLGQACFSVRYDSKGASIPPEARTVSVEFFENRAPIVEPTLSRDVTEALKDYIQSNTRLLLINGIGDLHFEGEITGYDNRSASIGANDLATQDRFTITIRAKYTNAFDEEKKWDASFSRFRDYPSTQSFEAAKTEYTKEILDLLIEDIFNKAFVNW